MKTIKCLMIFTFFTSLLISCSKEDTTDNSGNLATIEITATPASSSIDLSWKPVDGCSWYKIYIAEAGTTLKENALYQDLSSNPIKYTLTGLIANTSYDIKMEGTDYASGGKLIASKTLTVKTKP